MLQMVNLKRQYRYLEDEIDSAVFKVLAKGQFINGPNVHEFEQSIADYFNVGHAIGVGNGTDALVLALESCGIGPGDEVITPAFTFFATSEAIVRVDAIPVLVDIEPYSYCIDVTKIESKITTKTKAILPVHLFGHPADMDYIMDIAKRYKLKVIEDAAQSFGAICNGKQCGTIGDVGCLSFFPSKNLGCYGDGGMVITNDDVISKNVSTSRNHGSSEKYHHRFIGHNSRLDEIQAAILNVKLKYIDYMNDLRRENANIYKNNLNPYKAIIPIERRGMKHVYHQFTIRSDKRDEIAEELRKNDIASAIHYPIPIHKQEAFFLSGERYNLDLLVSEDVANKVLSLPMFPEMKEEEIIKVCRVVNGV